MPYACDLVHFPARAEWLHVRQQCEFCRSGSISWWFAAHDIGDVDSKELQIIFEPACALMDFIAIHALAPAQASAPQRLATNFCTASCSHVATLELEPK